MSLGSVPNALNAGISGMTKSNKYRSVKVLSGFCATPVLRAKETINKITTNFLSMAVSIRGDKFDRKEFLLYRSVNCTRDFLVSQFSNACHSALINCNL